MGGYEYTPENDGDVILSNVEPDTIDLNIDNKNGFLEI